MTTPTITSQLAEALREAIPAMRYGTAYDNAVKTLARFDAAQQAAGEQALPICDPTLTVCPRCKNDVLSQTGCKLFAAQSSQPLPLRDEREAFEAWYAEWQVTPRPWCGTREEKWAAWQAARAALPQPAPEAQQAEPAAGKESSNA